MMPIVVRVALVVAGAVLVVLALLVAWDVGGALAIGFNLGSIAIVIALIQLPVARTTRMMQRWLWLWPLGSYFGAIFVVTIFWDQHGNQRFFELTSQIIPILVLALIIELRLLTPTISNVPGQLAAGVLTLLLLALGEFHSLAVVSENPSEEAFTNASAALIAGLVGLIVGALAVSE